MQLSITIFDWIKSNARVLLFAAGYFAIWLLMLNTYLPFTSLPFILGLLALPFTIKKSNTAYSKKFAVLSVIFIALSFLVPVKTVLFFSIGFALLFLMSSFVGDAGFLSCCTLVFITPVFQYAANVSSFPIRLQLTALSGKLFAISSNDIITAGNIITYKGNEFSVDPACMGLNMLVTSLLLGVILIGYYQKKYSKDLKWYWVMTCFVSIIILNVVSNLLRILLLVHFVILPQNPLHETVGLVCLMMYVLLPSSFLIKNVVKKFAWEQQSLPAKQKGFKNVVTVNLLLFCFVCASAFYISKADTYKDYSLKTSTVADYKASVFTPGVIKLENATALVYIKYIRGFYDSDHNPTICWKGSGYDFQQTQQVVIDGHKIYKADLVNGKEKLYTAWWYGNGSDDNTTHPFTWRWNMMKSKKRYAVINVTAASEKELDEEVKRILHQRLLLPLFTKV